MIDGFKDLKHLKPPTDFVSPEWIEDMYLTEQSETGRALWLVVMGALQMLIGICIGFWLGTA